MCRGHFHAPGALLPISQFYVHKSGYRKGKSFSRCKRCWVWQKDHPKRRPGYMHLVPVVRFQAIVTELRRRIGVTEAARRIGMSVEHLSEKRLAEKRFVRGSTYDAALKVLLEAREREEDDFDALAIKMANLDPRTAAAASILARSPRAKLEAEIERRRSVSPWYDPFTWEECQAAWKLGLAIPLDLVANEFWWPKGSPFPRFSEEFLGDEF